MTTSRPRVVLVFVLVLAWGAAPARAQTYAWNGNTGDWTFDGNWSGSLAPSGAGAGDTLVFGGPSGYTATNNYLVNSLPAVYLNRLTTDGAADVTLNAFPGTFPNHTALRFLGPSPGITHASTGPLNVLTPINVGTGQSVGIVINSGAGQATFGPASTASSFLIGTGDLSITNNSATAVRIGHIGNNFSGTLNLSGGNFQVTATGGSPFGNRMVLNVASGATFSFNTNNTALFGGLSGGGNVIFGGSSHTFQSDADLTFSGGVTGTTSGFEKGGRSGNSAYTWAGDVAYTGGPTTVSNGTIRLVNGGRISGTNAYNVRNGATLTLDNTGSANHNDRLNNSAAVTLAGNLNLLGRDDTATTETVGNLVVAGTAGSQVTVSPGGGTGTATLTVANILRGNERGAFVEFAGSGTVAVTGSPTLTGGILGYAAKGTDWATVSGGSVVALATYQTGTDPTAWAATDNVSVGGALAGPVGTRTINSLKIAAANPIDVGSGNTLTLATGGILAAESATINNGTIVGNQSANKEVVAFVADGKTLTINSAIGDAGTQSLVKAGPGTLVLGGANAHSGGTFVHGGTLEASADGNLGAAGAPVSVAGATLRLTGNGTVSSGRALTLSGWNNTIEVAGTTTATFSTIASTANTASGGFTKTGTGTLIGNASGLVGPITVAAGTFRTSNTLSGENVVTVAPGAVLDLSFVAAPDNVGTLSSLPGCHGLGLLLPETPPACGG